MGSLNPFIYNSRAQEADCAAAGDSGLFLSHRGSGLGGLLPAAAQAAPTQQQQKQKKRRHQQQQQQQQPITPVAAAGVAVSLYCGARAGLCAYQALRRRCLRRLLRVVGPALAACGCNYYVDFGSLLGAVREGDVIFYDNDADVVAINPDWDALLVKLRAALPPAYKVYFVVPSEDASIRWLRVLYGIGILDIYGGYYGGSADSSGSGGGSNGTSSSSGGGGGGRDNCSSSNNNTAGRNTSSSNTTASACGCGCGGTGGKIFIPQGHGDLCDVPASLVLPLRPLQFRGVTLSGPADARGVLTHRYGADYMVPKYMHKGRDAIEQGKRYVRLLTLLAKFGVRV
jgi:hypothetical protein